jgi:hypothetical protein
MSDEAAQKRLPDVLVAVPVTDDMSRWRREHQLPLFRGPGARRAHTKAGSDASPAPLHAHGARGRGASVEVLVPLAHISF